MLSKYFTTNSFRVSILSLRVSACCSFFFFLINNKILLIKRVKSILEIYSKTKELQPTEINKLNKGTKKINQQLSSNHTTIGKIIALNPKYSAHNPQRCEHSSPSTGTTASNAGQPSKFLDGNPKNLASTTQPPFQA